MAALHSLEFGQMAEAGAPSSLDSPTRVIEVGALTAGIAVPDVEGVRFYSSDRSFDALDGALFDSVALATRAARDVLRRPVRRGVPKLSLVG